MGTLYQKAPKAVVERAQRLIDQHYTQFNEVKLRIDYLFARAELDDNGEPKGPAIMHGGYPCDGLCRIVNLRDRAKGNGDAEITLDGDKWERMSGEEQDALLDHELFHISLVMNRDGVLETDDLNRPKIRMRKHDFQAGWFHEIARRHGKASGEVQQAHQLMAHVKTYFQTELKFANAA